MHGCEPRDRRTDPRANEILESRRITTPTNVRLATWTYGLRAWRALWHALTLLQNCVHLATTSFHIDTGVRQIVARNAAAVIRCS
jgi:hypothetical protein